MFLPNSRYAKAGTHTVVTAQGVSVSVTRLPLRPRPKLAGYHLRLEGQRLDLIANHRLGDPTQAFRLCDASGAIAPDALAERELIAVPVKER